MSTPTEEITGLKSKLQLTEEEIKKKQKTVEEKESEFKELDNKIQNFIQTYSNKIIKLNIGGKIFTTKISTLLSVKDTLFYMLIGDYIKKGIDIPECLFFDRSYDYFELILNYLRFKLFSMKKFTKFEKEDIKDEVEFYGLTECLSLNKKNNIEIEWDQGLSKNGTIKIDKDDKNIIEIHSTTCYTHFVTNKLFKDEDFQIDLEVNVKQSDNFLYVGLFNNSYSTAGNCGCCNPPNAFYVQCDGSVHINGAKTEPNTTGVGWNSQKVLISMRVYLSEGQKKMYFVFPEKNDKELGPYNLTGSDFRVYAGHCNKGDGTIHILDCFDIK